MYHFRNLKLVKIFLISFLRSLKKLLYFRFSPKRCIIIISLLCIYQLYSFGKNNHKTTPLKIKVLNFDPKRAFKGTKSLGGGENMNCKIPKLEMNNSQVLNTYKKLKPLECDKLSQNWLFIDENNRLQATQYGKTVIGIDSMVCMAKHFYYLTDLDVKWSKEKQIYIGNLITDGDFTMIKCENGNRKWEHLFMNLVPKKNLIKKLKTKPQSKLWSGLSVYWFAFDSLSQMAFRRLLPKTIDYLENRMKAVTLNGYNIVGDGTPQAYIPILTGKTELELPLTRKRYPEANYVDVYPFIWNNFSDNGYITMYGEDAAEVGTFTYRLKGFQKQPTDHYTRPFFLISEKKFPDPKCFGSEPQHKSWFQYGKDFMTKYPKDIPKLGILHHSILSHNTITLVNIIDDDLKAHFEELFEGGHFDNTVVFVASDHGHRFSALRETQQGQLEERLPFMSVILPEKFKATEKGSKVYRNLKENANSLTTPFDLYETFLDILSLPEDLDVVQSTAKRGASLFRPISKTRSCHQAGIDTHWCTCLSWQKGDNSTAQILAQAVVDTINAYTKNERQLCAFLKLDKVLDSKKLVPNENVLKYGGAADIDGFLPEFNGKAVLSFATYMITFTTMPGNAQYEATVQYDDAIKQVTVDMLTISHVNTYGDTPHCIIDKNYFLAAYCVCYDKINNKS